MSEKKNITLGFIGFGELAQGLAKGLKGEGLANIKTFDKAHRRWLRGGQENAGRRRDDGRNRSGLPG